MKILKKLIFLFPLILCSCQSNTYEYLTNIKFEDEPCTFYTNFLGYWRFYTIETKDSLDKFVNTITPALEDNYHSNVLSSSFLSYVGKIKEKDFKKYFYIIWSSPCRIESSSPTAEKMYYKDSSIYINIQAELLDETDDRTINYFFISKLKIDFYRVKSFTLNLKVNYKNSEDQLINTYNYSKIYSERVEYVEGIENF